MARGIAEVAFEAVVSHLVDNWKRTALAAFDQGVTVPDPGHGRDEICPVAVVGVPFDPDSGADVAPFTAAEIKDGATQDGVGFLAVEPRPLGRPFVLTPGPAPEQQQDTRFEVTIVTPTRRGPYLATVYAGALAMLFRYVTLVPEGIDSISTEVPPPELPDPQGDDGTWRYDQWAATLAVRFRGAAVGIAA